MAGEMLWYQGKPAFTCYTRDCGGRTEDGAVVWNVPEPYLKSHEDPYCAAAQWRWQADPQEIVAALRQSDLRSPGAVARVEVVARTPSGRAQTLALEGAGETVRVSASAFRFALGRAFGWNTGGRAIVTRFTGRCSKARDPDTAWDCASAARTRWGQRARNIAKSWHSTFRVPCRESTGAAFRGSGWEASASRYSPPCPPGMAPYWLWPSGNLPRRRRVCTLQFRKSVE